MPSVKGRLLALLALLLLAVVAARGATAFQVEGLRVIVAQHPVPPKPAATLPNAPGNPAVAAAETFYFVLTIVALMFGAAAVVSLLAMRVRRRHIRAMVTTRSADDSTVDPSTHTSASALLQAGQQALRQFHANVGGPPSDRVIAAWLSLEEAATDSGTQRQPHQTPTEFVGSVLTEHEVDSGSLHKLRTLYGRARFGRPDAMTPADAEAAGVALDRIVADLAEAAE